MKIRILPEARQDLLDGFAFYEKQESGLGLYFLETLFSDIDSLKLFSGIHLIHHGQHRLLSKRFPFAIYYTVNGSETRVYAVLDCRQDPKRIQERLNS